MQITDVEPKDIVHVWAAVPFRAESLDVKFAHFFDKVVVTLHMFQLTVITLHTEKRRKPC